MFCSFLPCWCLFCCQFIILRIHIWWDNSQVTCQNNPALTSLCDWSIQLAPPFQPITFKIQTNRDSLHNWHLPVFSLSSYLHFVIFSFCSDSLSWPVWFWVSNPYSKTLPKVLHVWQTPFTHLMKNWNELTTFQTVDNIGKRGLESLYQFGFNIPQ